MILKFLWLCYQDPGPCHHISQNHRQFSEGTNITGVVLFLINIRKLEVSSAQDSNWNNQLEPLPQISNKILPLWFC